MAFTLPLLPMDHKPIHQEEYLIFYFDFGNCANILSFIVHMLRPLF